MASLKKVMLLSVVYFTLLTTVTGSPTTISALVSRDTALNFICDDKYFGERAEVSCFNAMGTLLRQTTVTIEPKLTFSIADNVAGIYFWRIVTERGQACFRVIRQ